MTVQIISIIIIVILMNSFKILNTCKILVLLLCSGLFGSVQESSLFATLLFVILLYNIKYIVKCLLGKKIATKIYPSHKQYSIIHEWKKKTNNQNRKSFEIVRSAVARAQSGSYDGTDYTVDPHQHHATDTLKYHLTV